MSPPSDSTGGRRSGERVQTAGSHPVRLPQSQVVARAERRQVQRSVRGDGGGLLLEQLINALLIGGVLWAPIPLGSNRQWAWSLLAAYFGVLLVLWALGAVTGWANVHRETRKLAIPALLLAVATLWSFVQIAPWTPADWHHPAWSMAGDALSLPTGGAIAIAPWRLSDELLKAGIAVAAFFIAFQCGGALKGPYWTLGAIVSIIAVHSVYALVVFVLGPETSLWHGRQDFSSDGTATGTFANGNSFGTYLGLGAMVVTVLVMRAANERIVTGHGVRIFLSSVISFTSGPASLLLVAGIVIVAALLLTQSVGAIWATAFGLLTVLALANGFRRGWTRSRLLRGVLAATIAALFLSGLFVLDAQLERRGASDLMRSDFYEAAIRGISDAPLLGYGPGSFADVYPLYTDQSFPYEVDKAHNDYLEVMLERGLVFGTVWLAGIAWPALLCASGAVRRRRRHWLPLAAAGAATVAAAHALVDFSLQIPGVAVTFAALLGSGTAHAFPSSRSEPS